MPADGLCNSRSNTRDPEPGDPKRRSDMFVKKPPLLRGGHENNFNIR
jgi:hypothetical protein